MTHQARRRGLAVALAGLLLGASLAVARAQGVPTCPPGEPPPFAPGLAPLAEQLGAIAGRPVECARSNPDNADTLQHTSTGLAYVRAQTATPTFTDGSRHWALTPDGVRCWTGASADPPPSTELPRLVATAPVGTPDPWVAGEALPARIAPAPFDVAAADVLVALKLRCLPIVGDVTVGATQPRQPPGPLDGPLSKVTFHDARLPAWTGDCGRQCDVADGGAVEVFVSPFQAERGREAAGRLQAGSGAPGVYAYVRGNILLRVTARLPGEQAGRYDAALRQATDPAAH